MQRFKIPIRPGSMVSDISENEIGKTIHLEVKNLRQNKLLEWQTVPGYINVNDLAASDVKNGLEITDDLSGARFIIYQQGTSLKVLNYNLTNSPLAGYENESPSTLSLPSGVTIGSSAKCRFFFHNGIVRISGPSEPLWYGYISRTIFENSVGSGSIAIAQWYLAKASLYTLESLIINSSGEIVVAASDAAVTSRAYIKFFAIYDDGQYSLLSPTGIDDANDWYVKAPIESKFVNFTVQITGTNLKTNFPQYRLTGIGIAIATSELNLIDENELVWYVQEVLPIKDDDFPALVYTHEYLHYDSGSKDTLYFQVDGSGNAQYYQDALIQIGDILDFENANGERTEMTVTAVTHIAGNDYIIQFDKNIYSIGGSIITSDITQDVDATTIGITRKWSYDAGTGYNRKHGIDVTITPANNYWDYADIPTGTLSNTPNYSHHQTALDRSYCLSEETDEQDIIRYSPINQPDNFPILNLIQTPVGDIDSNIGLTIRDDRFVILKRNSISQGQFSGSSYYHDQSGKRRGLYADEGYIVVDDILYFMDRDDVYIFNGVNIVPWLQNQRLRTLYRDAVSSTSFFGYDPINKELYLFLDSLIMVYNFEFNQWYLRETDITPNFAFTDYDKRIFVSGYYTVAGAGNLYKIMTFTHNETDFDETIAASFKTGFIDMRKPEYKKILHKLFIRAIGSEDLTIVAKDLNETRTYTATQTPPASVYRSIPAYPAYIFNEVYVEVSFASASDLSGSVKSFDALIGVWR